MSLETTTKYRILIGILFFLFHFAAAQTDIEIEAEKLNNEAFNLLKRDKYSQAFKTLKKAENLLENTKHYYQKAKNTNIYGLAYFQINDLEKARLFYHKSNRIADSIMDPGLKNDRKISAHANIIYTYIENENYKAYDSIIPYYNALLKKGNYVLSKFYGYDNDMILASNRKDFKKILLLSTEALDTLNHLESVTLKKDTTIVYDHSELLRLKNDFKIYKAFALMELQQDIPLAYNLLNEILAQNLDEILWYEVPLFEKKMKIMYYKYIYFSSYNKNLDSARYYLKHYNEASNNIISYLEKKQLKSNKYILKNKEDEVTIATNDLLLKIEKDTVYREKLIILLASILLLGLLGFMYSVSENRKYTLKINTTLLQKHKALSSSVQERKLLNEKISSIQDIISTDLQTNFSSRFNDIQNAHEILKEVNAQPDVNISKFKKLSKILDLHITQLTIDIKDLIWASNTENNKMLRVVNRIITVSEEYQKIYQIRIDVISKVKKDIKIPKYWNRQILLIVKKSIQHISKYSDINILITLNTKGFLHLIIHGDKKAYSNNEMLSPSTLLSLKANAAFLGLELEIVSNTTKGTIIELQGTTTTIEA